MLPETTRALVERFREYSVVVEVGIGDDTAVAAALAADCTVKATDIVPCAVPDRIEFYIDDITDPTFGIYSDCDLVYGLNLPPELQAATASCATRFDADFAFTTLGFDPPLSSVTSEPIPGDTLFWFHCSDEPGSIIHR